MRDKKMTDELVILMPLLRCGVGNHGALVTVSCSGQLRESACELRKLVRLQVLVVVHSAGFGW